MANSCPIDKLEKILVSTDGSEFSEGAVREAINLAGKCSSKLIAMAVVEVNEEYASEAPALVEKEEVRARELLDSVKARASEAGVDCDSIVHEGDAAWRFIVDEAQKQAAELIVMGRRGRTGLAKAAMGSVTARVIGHAPCGVLVVPRAGTTGFKTILAATDGSTYGEAAVGEAIKMAQQSGGRLVCVSVAASGSDTAAAEENLAKAKEMAAAAGVETETRAPAGKAYREIVAAAEEINADLIVVGCHGRTGLAKLLMGSVTERVIGHASCTVLVAIC